MAEDHDTNADDQLLDYDEEEPGNEQKNGEDQKQVAKKDVKGTYVSIHSSGFRDFLLKPELLRSIVDCGFEHPSEGENTSLSGSSTWRADFPATGDTRLPVLSCP